MQTENPMVADGIGRLQTVWPQTHHEQNPTGYNLVFIPGVLLPKGWDKTICTVLFVVPPGFPAARPDHFFTDINIRIAKNKAIPKCTNTRNGEMLAKLGWPQWRECQWWSWHLQVWDPNRSNLFNYMKAIQWRLTAIR